MSSGDEARKLLKTPGHDRDNETPSRLKALNTHGHIDAERCPLGDYGGYGRAADAHAERVNEDVIEDDIGEIGADSDFEGGLCVL